MVTRFTSLTSLFVSGISSIQINKWTVMLCELGPSSHWKVAGGRPVLSIARILGSAANARGGGMVSGALGTLPVPGTMVVTPATTVVLERNVGIIYHP